MTALLPQLRIAVLMTCHDRRGTTLACLEHLHAAALPDRCVLRVYLVDDASSDVTAAEVRERFPSVHLIQGDGSLYWCGGMRLAWRTALLHTPDADAFLWLNDDVELGRGALEMLLTRLRRLRADRRDASTVLCGATYDPATGDVSYGLRTRTTTIRPDGSWRPFRKEMLLNGNCVLVPRAVYDEIGGLSPRFTHAMADVEFGLRCLRGGVSLELAPEYVGACAHPGLPGWRDPALPLPARFRLLLGPKGMPPWEYYHLIRLIRPVGWPLSLLKLPLIALAPRLFGRGAARRTGAGSPSRVRGWKGPTPGSFEDRAP